MDNKEEKSNLQTPAIPGTAWVQRRSKTYNHVYYFNTETGETVWDLSHAEIEKAQKTIQNVISKPKMTNDGCPEPKLPPKEPPNCDQRQYFEQKTTPSKIYNKQIINNSFTRQPYPITTVLAPNCSHAMPPSSLAIPGPSSTVMSIPGSAINYNIWTIPSVGHQIFIAPVLSPNVDQIPGNVVNATSMSTKTSETLANSGVKQDNDMTKHSSHCQTINESHSQTSPRHFQSEKFITKDNNTIFDETAHQVHTEDENINRKTDWRQFLASRKITIQHDVDESEDVRSEAFSVTSYEGSHPDNTSNTGILPLNDTGYSDIDSDWLEENINAQGSKVWLDVTSLKMLASSVSNTNCWYIAVDKTILLRHLHFLIMLYNSDEDCRLMVPRVVLDELRAEAKNKSFRRASRRARRAVMFVTKLNDSAVAIIGAEVCEDSDIEIPHVLNCCIKLVEQYYHVVLISNDTELQRYKNNPSVPIFSIVELKDFLAKEDHDEEEVNEETNLSPPSSYTEKLKIVIPNNLSVNNQETSGDDEERNPSDIDIWSNKSQNRPREKHENKHLSTSFKSYKPDAGIKTDEPTVHIASTNHFAKISNAQTSCAVKYTKARDNTQSKNMSKIRLKRSTLNPPVPYVAASEEKKQFKWRRRRDTHANKSNSTHDPNQPSKHADNVPAITETNTITAGTFKVDEISKVNLESCETCTANFDQNNLSKNLVIEETSTSGVISNTTSNFDSMRSSVDKETVNKNLMFDVTDHSMGENLNMRCDEWVSRYVQIMEEVLSQVLQQYPQFLPNLTPPPWNLHEATECIRIMFQDERDVNDAVNKLLKVLENVCDDRKSGIRMDIRPSDYMQLYSYGVYLVEKLQLVVKNFEDLQTAAESLSKLLYDIKTPSLDSSHNNSLRADQAGSTVIQVSKDLLATRADHKSETDTKDRTEVLEEVESQRYNLRSKNRQLEQKEINPEPQNTIFIRDLHTDFFKSLNLQKQVSDPKLQNMFNDNIQKDVSNDQNLSPLAVNSQSCSKNLSFSGDIEEDKSVEDRAEEANMGTVETKFVRNFTICPEFEKKIEKQSKPLDIDEPHDSECFKDNYDYVQEPNENTEFNDIYHYQEYPLQACETQVEEVSVNKNSEQTNPEVDKNSNTNFKVFCRQTMLETKQAFLQVTVFCRKCAIDLTNGHSYTKRTDILNKANQAYQSINNLHKHLSSILRREKLEPGKYVPSALREVGVASLDFSDMKAQQYGAIVEKYMNECTSLLAVINTIIDAVKS